MSDLYRENANLRRILEVTRYLAVTTDLDVLLGTIVEAACEVLVCERATIFLYDAKTKELYSRVAKGVDAIRFPADRGIAGVAAIQRTCVNVPNAYADPRFNREVDRKTGFQTRNLLTFPLENINGDLIGVLQALNKVSAPFDDDDEALARVLSAQAGVALDRARLLEEYAEKQRMARDLDLAREIQRAQFPKSDPSVDGYEVAGWNRPADETGGDAFDFIPLEDGRLAFFLADATGHGIGPALIVAECRSLMRAMLSVTSDLRRIANRVNALLLPDMAEERFVTAILGVLDPRTNRVEYISGGQAPLLFVCDGRVERRIANALPFGIIDDFDAPPPDAFEFAPGSMLALLTDGFYEALSPAEQQFGEERVSEFLSHPSTNPLPCLIDGLQSAVKSHQGTHVQSDDLTAILIRRKA
ncbi:MAG: GAF domain-containing SpoIIE family protein phosphatase [Phycisphaerae bacterium]